MNEIVSEFNPNRDFTPTVLTGLLNVHRDFFEIIGLAQCRSPNVSDAMLARLFLIDNSIVHTYTEINADLNRACPVLDDLGRSLGSPVVRMWTPNDVQGVFHARRSPDQFAEKPPSFPLLQPIPAFSDAPPGVPLRRISPAR